jgi:hypothetical protein
MTSASGVPDPLRLSGQQRALYQALSEKDDKLARMYSGALTVLGQSQNGDRLALAAHGLRELMEKFPLVLGIEIKAQKESLKAKVIELQECWDDGLKQTQCFREGQWDGDVDVPLKKVLVRISSFFQWLEGHNPRRKEEFINTIRQIDISGRRLPRLLEDLNAEAWEGKRDFFQAVAHHRKYPDDNEFIQWLNALELFLLERLHPRTFADFDLLDEIIGEGESRD